TDTLSNQTVSRTADFTVKPSPGTKTAAVATPGREGNVKQERPRSLGGLVTNAMVSSLRALPAAAQPQLGPGNVAGVVRDAAGTPQHGASVELIPEAAGLAASRGLLTNTQGIFRAEKLAPGLYCLRVTLAGFLPTIEKHVRISSNLTTVVRVQLESM